MANGFFSYHSDLDSSLNKVVLEHRILLHRKQKKTNGFYFIFSDSETYKHSRRGKDFKFSLDEMIRNTVSGKYYIRIFKNMNNETAIALV